MPTITLEELKALIARNDWVRTQDIQIIEIDLRTIFEDYDHETQEIERIEVPHTRGVAGKTSTLEGISIVYTEGFNFDKYDSSSLTHGTDGQEVIWVIDGAYITDEDDNELGAWDLADYLTDEFSSIDYSELNIDEVTDIDLDENADMDTITIELDGEPDIRFTGVEVASVSSRSTYNDKGRWTVLTLYKTAKGKFICHQVGHSNWINEKTRYSGKVCETADEAIQFFGQGSLAKDLYYEASISNLVDVE